MAKKNMTPAQLRAMHAKKGYVRKGGMSTSHPTSNDTPDISALLKNARLYDNKDQKVQAYSNQINKKNYGRKTNTELTPEKKEIRQKEIRAMIEWSGCVITPQHCAIITGVNLAYDIYKTDNKDRFQKIIKIATSNINDQMLENPLDLYSKVIFSVINDCGFRENIMASTPEKFEFDENIFRYLIKGTIKNLINDTIDNVM